MKKNDKLIVVLGVIVLVVASLGIYYVGEEESVGEANINDILKVTGHIQNIPGSIKLSDGNHFFPLIATPVAVHYDEDCKQEVIPLYVENFEDVSNSVERLQRDQLNKYRVTTWPDTESARNLSLKVAKDYWKSSKAVLIIEESEEGYNLGVAATPIASYLSIPVIVTDKIDEDVEKVLEDLGVEMSLVCGDIDGYKDSYKFDDMEEIMDISMQTVRKKFSKIDYITVANPRDSYPPEVLNETEVVYEKGVLTSSSSVFPDHFLNSITTMGNPVTHTFTIPEDYKYALVKLDVKNLEDPEHVEKFGDNILIQGSLTGYLRTVANPAKRDDRGNILEDRLHFETVVYDEGGKEYDVKLLSSYHVLDEAEYEISITVEKLSDPYYPMMPKFSSMAPYLTSYYKGIVFAKPDFAFAPTDDVRYNGNTLPGNTQVFYNPDLIPKINQHVYENIHVPMNDLLAQIRDIDISDTVEYLTKDYEKDPVYIALLGDTIMLPQYYYRSPHSDPFDNPSSGSYGTNVPSDFIYGNTDPEMYSLQPYDKDHLERDMFGRGEERFPVAENIVGRLTGYDIQDVSALIARNFFYNDILEELEEWKDNAAVLIGAGCEMQKLPLITFINKAFFGNTEPQKFPSGEKYFLLKYIIENFEKGGFDTLGAERGRAQMEGYSWEALKEIQKDGIGNRLWFRPLQVKFRQGIENIESFKPKNIIQNIFGGEEEVVIGGELEKTSNFIITDCHAIWFEKEFGDVLMNELGMPVPALTSLLARYFPLGIRSQLDQKGAFAVRELSNVDMGPSVILAEGCGSGKIDGMLPTNSLANTYMHAGVNAYISPTTLSAFYGALEPRPKWPLLGDGVGFGVIGYVKTLMDYKLNNEYPPLHFNQWIFDHILDDLYENDIPVGTALRNAKNEFLPSQFDVTYRWTPPLSLPSNLPQNVKGDIYNNYESTSAGTDDRFPVEKYSTIFQINLLGDPAFNPYEPINEGS
jgi:hypothetical protein